MRRLFEAAGVDYAQWKALVATALKRDLRQAALGRSRRQGRARVAGVLLMQVVAYTLYGAFLSLFVWSTLDVFFAGTVAMTYVLFLVGTIVLLDHNSALTSPEDYLILGFRPVTSRTYFAARLANVLVYTTAITTVAGGLPIVAFFRHFGAAVGTASIAAFYACSFSMALAILFAYGWLLRIAGPDRLRRVLSYVQLSLGFVMYGGYFFFAHVLRAGALASFTLPKTPGVLLFPATWFASYLEIADGRTGAQELLPAAATIAALGVMVAGVGRRLSLEYSERLGAIAAESRKVAPPRPSSGPGLWFRTGEGRAVALLVKSQFRNDMKFRLGVLGILPLTLLYVMMGVSEGGVQDPFAPSGRSSGFSFVTFAVLMFPWMLRASIIRSDGFRASWIFFASPADRAKMVRAAKNVLTAFFLAPYLLLLGGVYAYFVPNLTHVALHIALLGLTSHFLLQVGVLLDPALPFSRPVESGRRAATFFGFFLVVGGASVVLQVFSAGLYARPIALLSAFASLLGVSVAADLLTRARVARQARKLEFEG